MSLNKDITNTQEFIKNYFDYNYSIIQSLDYAAIEKFVDLILDSRRKRQSIFFIGNGAALQPQLILSTILLLVVVGNLMILLGISLCDNQA